MDKEPEQGQDQPKQGEQQAGGDDYEFMIPLNSLVKTKPFVDRYFLKHYKIFSHPVEQNLNCN